MLARHGVHGVTPRDSFTFRGDPGRYLVYLGRMSPEKRVDRAIEIAKRARMPLKIAAKIYPEERHYFDETLAPLIQSSQPLVDFVGEIGDGERDVLLGNAAAFMFPIEWPEPFGLVMIEALACGTPVIGFRRGSIPEVLDDGVTVWDSIGKPSARWATSIASSRAMPQRSSVFDATHGDRYLDVRRVTRAALPRTSSRGGTNLTLNRDRTDGVVRGGGITDKSSTLTSRIVKACPGRSVTPGKPLHRLHRSRNRAVTHDLTLDGGGRRLQLVAIEALAMGRAPIDSGASRLQTPLVVPGGSRRDAQYYRRTTCPRSCSWIRKSPGRSRRSSECLVAVSVRRIPGAGSTCTRLSIRQPPRYRSARQWSRDSGRTVTRLFRRMV